MKKECSQNTSASKNKGFKIYALRGERIMHFYNMMDVGDGLCFSFHNYGEEIFQVDCGTNNNDNNNNAKNAFEKLCKLPPPQNIILSHFHKDHYNGFQWGAQNRENSLASIKNVYYPGIPEFKEEPSLAKDFLCCLYWSQFPTFGKNTGDILDDFLTVIYKLNGNKSFNHIACFEGDICA